MPLVVAFASGAKVNGMAAKACATLGLLSYGVYVLHVPLKVLTEFTLSTLHIRLPFGALDVIMIALVAAIAAAMAHRFYDTPVRSWLTGRAKRRLPQVTTGEVG
jgi:peptidoglycan/LPS O-acetylase OafA/YrhL